MENMAHFLLILTSNAYQRSENRNMTHKTDISHLKPQTIWQRFVTPVQIRDGHDNFFTPLRLLMAFLVVIGHASVIANRDLNAEPHLFFDYGFSYLAVNVFFIASGFLVTKSMTYRGDIEDYSSARLLRIYPALIAHLLFVMFVIGPLSTSLPIWEYLTHSDVWKQPLLVLTFLNTDVILPGVFTGNEEQFASAPLWTLRYELIAYVLTAFVFALGLMRRKWMILAQFILPSIAWLVTKELGIFETLSGTVQNCLRFGVAYGLGATFFAYKDRIKFHLLGFIIVTLLAFLLGNTPSVEISTNLFLGYGLMLLAYMKAPKFSALQKIPDISYGVYIYHWCLLQLFFQWFPALSMWALLAIAVPVTIAISTLSWYWVEKPCLRAKIKLAQGLRFGKTRKPFNRGRILLD
ncbi:peptidoglycan/LPS O-acetylase OafA/YrhL [Litorimonas taeanensis]|uniref:Peptidoglycan/LPS O-acetylase OafA/YrhL n=2 Tax=Litorimonas taeanensis TaxID=568099 RepID=A0A420WJ82_9PROT|nr:peptidoglycan/LPS O-acetylase OafA/YrhL [Litorimonas taeanensis]